VSAIRVLVADDHPTFVRAVSMLLDADPAITVVGGAGDGDEAVRLALELQPDVVLMDVNMPGTNGIDATAQILQATPHVAVIVLTMFDDDDSVAAAIRNGARGYLLKGARQGELRRAVQCAHDGQAVFGPEVIRKLSALVDRPPADTAPNPFPQLTAREYEVLELVARGFDNATIARELLLSTKTVRNYVSLVLTKVQATTRAEAIVVARNAGLGCD
jgi:DNA-binding NarL/FixJ family response regulator